MGNGRRRAMNPNAISKDRPLEIWDSTPERENFILPSGYTVRQSFAALYKLWKQFNAYRHYFDMDMQKVTAAKIQDVQREMGIAVAIFPEFGLYITDEELPLDEEHAHEQIIALHDMIEQRKSADEYSEDSMNEAYNSRKEKEKRQTCDYWRYG